MKFARATQPIPTQKRFGSGKNRFSELVLDIADTQEKREAVFNLRYRTYLGEGAIKPKPNGLLCDDYDNLDSSFLFRVSHANGITLGSLRFAVQVPTLPNSTQKHASSPEFQIFSDVLRPLIKEGRAISSGAKFSIDTNFKRRSEVALLLMLAQVKASFALGCKWGIATARGSHLKFYKRILLMEPLCAARPMPGLLYSYDLLVGNIDQNYCTSLNQFPKDCLDHFSLETPQWETQIRQSLYSNTGIER